MKSFSSLLEKITKALGDDTHLKNAVIDSIKEFTGGTLKEDQFDIKEGILTINASPVVKNEIRLKEVEIRRAILDRTSRNIIKINYN
jgi:hypothetical protein